MHRPSWFPGGLAAWAILSCAACADASAPTPLPLEATRFEPEPVFRDWWTQIQECSGRSGDYDAVTWYYVPGEEPFHAPGLDKVVIGYWDPAGNRIVLLQFVPNRSALIRHEILHALIRRGDHPATYFQELCGAVINGPGLLPD